MLLKTPARISFILRHNIASCVVDSIYFARLNSSPTFHIRRTRYAKPATWSAELHTRRASARRASTRHFANRHGPGSKSGGGNLVHLDRGTNFLFHREREQVRALPRDAVDSLRYCEFRHHDGAGHRGHIANGRLHYWRSGGSFRGQRWAGG